MPMLPLQLHPSVLLAAVVTTAFSYLDIAAVSITVLPLKVLLQIHPLVLPLLLLQFFLRYCRCCFFVSSFGITAVAITYSSFGIADVATTTVSGIDIAACAIRVSVWL